MSQRYRKHDTSIGAVLSVTLDTGRNPQPVAEVFVKSDGAATFEIFGSSDNQTFRKSTEIVLGGAGESTQFYFNAFRYIKVSTSAINDNEIEIVAGG